MKLLLNDLLTRTDFSDSGSSSSLPLVPNERINLGMDVGIVSWPEIVLEVSNHFYVIFW